MSKRPSTPVLRVRNLSVSFDVDGVHSEVVSDVSFDVAPGQVLALVGESGSGKSVTALSILGLLPSNAQTSGSVLLGAGGGRAETNLVGASPTVLRSIRGSRIAMIFQDPQSALNPVFSIGFQLAEAVRLHKSGLTRAEVRDRVIELLELVEIPDATSRLRSFPHQLSGGQCQRIVIAMALAGEPDILIADEPTTALDVTVQAEILDVISRMRARLSSSVLLITHDMGVVAELADRVVVMKSGRIVEEGDAQPLFTAPTQAYTQELLAAVPRLGSVSTVRDRDAAVATVDEAEADSNIPIFEATNVVVEYKNRLRKNFRAVDEANLVIEAGEILALVGESGSGKTSLGMAAIGLAPHSEGSIRIAGTPIQGCSRPELKKLRRRMGVVFQNPATSLNPRFNVRDSVAEPIRAHLGLQGAELDARVMELLDSVGFGAAWKDRYPHELSGGQRQRVAIARALALNPDLLIADEPTSALDVSIQARILELFGQLQAELGFACLFITHDLAVVNKISTRVAVMRSGKIIETGSRDDVLNNPQHEYTQLLIDSVPAPEPDRQRARRLERIGV